VRGSVCGKSLRLQALVDTIEGSICCHRGFTGCVMLCDACRDLIERKEEYRESQQALARLVFSYLSSGKEHPLLPRSDAIKELKEHMDGQMEDLKVVPETSSRRAARTIVSLVAQQRALDAGSLPGV